MSIEWAVIKFTPDLRRQEPINVGVFVVSESAARLRVLGVSDDEQHIVGRWSGANENLRGWLHYWNSQISSPGVRVPDLLHERPGDNYAVRYGGRLLQGERPLDEITEELYDTLVRRDDDEAPARQFRHSVDTLIERSGLSLDEHFFRDFDIVTTEQELVKFPYAWVNGHTTVGRLVPLLRQDLVRSTLWELTTLPSEIHKLVFVPEVPEHKSRAAEILETKASLVVVSQTDPAEIRQKFLAGHLN